MKRMTKRLKVILISILVLSLLSLLFYCYKNGKTPEDKIGETLLKETKNTINKAKVLQASAISSLKNKNYKTISLKDNSTIASSNDVVIEYNNISIYSSGIYYIEGSINEGQVIVDTDDEVILILDNVEIVNSSDAAINIKNSKHTQIYLADDSTNTLISGNKTDIVAKEDNDAIGSTIYSKDDLSIAGDGSLEVKGYINNGISTTDHLVILNGNLNIEAINNCLKGKDSLTLIDGIINIVSGNDGIKSNNEEEAYFGNVDIQGGEINIISYGDGIEAANNITIENGIITINSSDTESLDLKENERGFEMPDNMPSNFPNLEDGNMENPFEQGGNMGEPFGQDNQAPQDFDDRNNIHNERRNESFSPDENKSEFSRSDFKPTEAPENNQPQDFNKESMPDMDFSKDFSNSMIPGGEMTLEEKNNDNDSSFSSKGIKAGNKLIVSDGTITIKSSDDAIHSNGTVTISGSTMQLTSKDDGVHADNVLTISNGNINILKSNEGIEAHEIYVDGGDISITSSDDGFNANGNSSMFPKMFERNSTNNEENDESTPILKITNGNIYVNANGDGLDSNGDLIIEGGNIIVDGPTNGGNGALDAGTENGGQIICNGGTIIAIGAPTMAETFDEESKQCSFIVTLPSTAKTGSLIIITNEEGNEIYRYTSAKTFNSIVFSSENLMLNKTYTILIDDQIETVTLDSISTGSSSSFSMPNGFGGKERNAK